MTGPALPSSTSGVLVVDKPAGLTSHDVVASVRRALGIKRVGHLGTLDPLATGVLPLVVGKATRLAPLYAGATKQYDAVIRLGFSTDTCDVTGTVLPQETPATDKLPSRNAIVETVTKFEGTYPQKPPNVSAKKIGGIRAYELVRKKRPVKLSAVTVTVDSLALLSIKGNSVRCRVAASSGFYVRSLARDLGAALGCGGCLETLRRERHGEFGLAQAIPLAQIVENVADAEKFIIPPEQLLPRIPAAVVSRQNAERVRHGNFVRATDILSLDTIKRSETPRLAESTTRPLVRLLDETGSLLAISEQSGDGTFYPKIVLPTAQP